MSEKEPILLTRLLISIRNAAEAAIVAERSIDLIDLKNPSTGALGAIDPTDRHWILQSLPSETAKSIAMGELADWPQLGAYDSIGELAWLKDFKFAKIGLAGVRESRNDWSERWLKLRSQLPAGVTLVGVAYADWKNCGAPSVEDVFELVSSLSDFSANKSDMSSESQILNLPERQVVLIDTYSKSGGSTIDCLGWYGIERLIEKSQSSQTLIAIAGSLKIADLNPLLKMRPDYIGFRGAVCDRGREDLSETKLSKLLEAWRYEAPLQIS